MSLHFCDKFNIRFGIVVAQTFQSPHLTVITDIGDLSVEDSTNNLEIELMSAAAEGAKLLHSDGQLWLDFFAVGGLNTLMNWQVKILQMKTGLCFF